MKRIFTWTPKIMRKVEWIGFGKYLALIAFFTSYKCIQGEKYPFKDLITLVKHFMIHNASKNEQWWIAPQDGYMKGITMQTQNWVSYHIISQELPSIHLSHWSRHWWDCSTWNYARSFDPIQFKQGILGCKFTVPSVLPILLMVCGRKKPLQQVRCLS